MRDSDGTCRKDRGWPACARGRRGSLHSSCAQRSGAPLPAPCGSPHRSAPRRHGACGSLRSGCEWDHGSEPQPSGPHGIARTFATNPRAAPGGASDTGCIGADHRKRCPRPSRGRSHRASAVRPCEVRDTACSPGGRRGARRAPWWSARSDTGCSPGSARWLRAVGGRSYSPRVALCLRGSGNGRSDNLRLGGARRAACGSSGRGLSAGRWS